MKRIYLLSTEHLENGLWFRDEEDFKVAMNYIAILAAQKPEVTVLAFILMSNHVHFVLRGDEPAVVDFINEFKRRYSMYLRNKHGSIEFLRHNRLDVHPVPYDFEAVEKAIAYVQMNPVAANICASPTQYPWGTGNVFFNSTESNGTRLGDMSRRAAIRTLHSETEILPSNWIIAQDGFILPQNYVDINGVESLFRTPKRMNFFLNNSSKAKKRIEADENLPAFKDQTILATLPDLLQSLFHKYSFKQLTQEEQVEAVKQIRFRFSADPNQIARVCSIKYAEAAKMIDSM
jgi:REP element-mobilizing transposase RayT